MLSEEKANEVIRFVFRKDAENVLGKPVGFVRKGEENDMKVEFEKRGELEEDETRLQVIPYVLIKLEEDGKPGVLMYIRSGSESRLLRKLSLGFGGHSSVEDATVRQTACREIKEEIGLDVNEEEMEFLGYIFSNADAVSRVHLGYVYVVNANKGIKDIEHSEEIEKICFYDGRQGCDGTLENWSQILIKSGIVKELLR